MQPDLSFYLEIKEIGDDGSFKGIASKYGVEDLGGDIIEKGAFTKTIAENPEVPVLWQHDSDEVIGKGTVSEIGNNVVLEAQLDMDDPLAKKAHGKLKKKLLKGLSIGFRTVKSSEQRIEEDGKARWIRHIQELKLWEVSVVTFPMLPSAQVVSVKSLDVTKRIDALEAQVNALSAKQAATPEPVVSLDLAPEPAIGERAAVKSTEPEVHSGLVAGADRLLKLLNAA